MATTTNYGWTTPDDTALVKDGAAAIRTLGSSVDTTTKNLNPSTTLGDIEYRSSTSNVNTRLGIGSAGQVLTVSGGVPSWQTGGSSGPAFYATMTANQAVSTATTTKIAYDSEIFDTDNCYSTTNYRFTPTKAGIYQVNAGLRVTGAGGYNQIDFYKNGASYALLFIEPDAQNGSTNTVVSLIQLNGSTDYIEMFGYAGGAGGSNFTPTGSFFSAVWIRGL